MAIITELQKELPRKLLIASIALLLGVLVIEVQPFRKWSVEVTGFLAPTISVLEFLVPKYKELE